MGPSKSVLLALVVKQPCYWTSAVKQTFSYWTRHILVVSILQKEGEGIPSQPREDLIQACGGLPEEAMREIAHAVLQAGKWVSSNLAYKPERKYLSSPKKKIKKEENVKDYLGPPSPL